MVLIEARANSLKCLAADAISKEAKVLDGLEFLELDSKIWAKAILNANLNRKFWQ